MNTVSALQGRGNFLTEGVKIGSQEQVMGKDDFLRLFLLQLQHQDPLNPVMDHEFVAQMAQFSSLEQMLQMNDTLSLFVQSQEYSTLASLIGKEATVTHPETGIPFTGEITGVRLGERPVLLMGELEVRMDSILEIKKMEGAIDTDKG